MSPQCVELYNKVVQIYHENDTVKNGVCYRGKPLKELKELM